MFTVITAAIDLISCGPAAGCCMCEDQYNIIIVIIIIVVVIVIVASSRSWFCNVIDTRILHFFLR